ncbi:MAG: hypothetical protein ACXADF_14480 [Candidatus Thorarchaeota archaeon]|jgi:hypothetical protein
MAEQIFLLHRSHETTKADFFKQTVGASIRKDLSSAQDAMRDITGTCIIIKGVIIDDNCIEDDKDNR